MRNLKRALSLALAFVMVMSLMIVGTSAKSYTDADKIDNQVAVEILGEIGVMIGNDDGSFAPDRDVTRAEMAVIITRILYGNNMNVDQFKNMNTFTDVPDWAEGFVNLCASLDIIAGRGNGIFDPDATVTTAEAALMLSRALGYFKNNAEFGNDWSLAAMKRATQAGIIGGDMVLQANAGLDRDDVAQMTFNTLTKAVPVQYNELLDVYYNENQGVIYALEFNYLQTLGYTNFNLVYKSNEQVEYGRPATTWGIGSYTVRGETSASGIEKADLTSDGGLLPTYVRMLDKDKIITVANTPVYVYDNGTKEKTIYSDLGAAACNEKDYEWTAFVNGKEVDVDAPEKNNTNNYAFTEKGAVTEIYVDDDTQDVTVVEINYYLGQVYSVDDGTTTIRSLSTGGKILDDRTFATEEFAEDDYVVFTVDYNDDNDYYICEMMAPETVTGDVARVENDNDSDDTYIRLDSKTGDKIYYTAGSHMVYDVNASNDQHPTLNEEYILYMTPAGYILGFELANEEVPQYLYVQDSDEELRDWTAKVILPDATEPKIDVDGDLDGKGPASIEWLSAKTSNIDFFIWDYSVNSSDVYSLTYVPKLYNMSNGWQGDAGITENSPLYQDRNDNGLWIRSGKAYVDTILDETAFIVDEDTIFVDTMNGVSYTGYSEVPTIYAEDVAYVVEDGVAQIVYILEGEVYDENMTYFFLTDNGKGTWETEKYDGDNYRVYEYTYVDGKQQELTIAYDALNAAEDVLSVGTLYRATRSFEADGTRYITEVQPVAVPLNEWNAFRAKAVGNNAFSIWTNDNWNKYTTNSDTTYVLVEREPVDGKAYEAAVKSGAAYTNFEWTVTPGRLSNLDDELDYTYAETFATVAKATDKVAELVYIYHITPDLGVGQHTVTVTDNQDFNETHYAAHGGNAVIPYEAPEGYHVVSVSNGATYNYATAEITLKNVTSDVALTVTLAKDMFISVDLTFAAGTEARVSFPYADYIKNDTLKLVKGVTYTIGVAFADNTADNKVLYNGNELTNIGGKYSFIAEEGAGLMILSETATSTVVAAKDSAELAQAISGGAKTIYLGSDTYTIAAGTIASDLTIIGNGDTTLGNVKVAAGDYDVNISGVNFSVAGGYGVNLPHNYLGDVTIENCTFTSRYGVYVDDAGKITVNDCIFNVTVCPFGWTNADEVVFTGNTVNGNPERAYIENHDSTTKVTSDYPLMSEVKD